LSGGPVSGSGQLAGKEPERLLAGGRTRSGSFNIDEIVLRFGESMLRMVKWWRAVTLDFFRRLRSRIACAFAP
jgi:hypothetical protein